MVIYGQAYDYVFNVVFEFEDILLQRHARDMSPSQLQLLHELVTWSYSCPIVVMSDLIRMKKVVKEKIRLIDPPLSSSESGGPLRDLMTHARSSHAFPFFLNTPTPENYAKAKNYN